MNRQNKGYTANFGTDDFSGSLYQADPMLEFLEHPVRFSFKYCDTRKYCIRKVKDSNNLKSVYSRLGHFEDMKWKELQNTQRESGISLEKKGSTNHKEMSKDHPEFNTFGHFRISATGKSKFRVFGAISDGLFYVLKFDVNGVINH